jgi:uncharacterized membrane protein
MQMGKPNVVTLASSAGLLAIVVAAAAVHPEPVEGQVNVSKPSYRYEKCYGVVKAGQNDCFGVGNSCGSTSKKDGDPQAWIYVPKGTCNKIVNGKVSPPS